MRTILVSLVATTTLLVIAPAAAQPPPMAAAIACRPIVTRVGSTFTITLPSNRTTGYSWALEDRLNGAIVAYYSKSYAARATSLIGAPGIELWTFSAVGRGRALIAMKYVRPWEKTAPPAKEALYVVVAR